MEHKMTQHAQLMALIADREAHYHTRTNEILSSVPNVTRALFDLIDIPEENMSWVDADIMDDLLVVAVTVSYAPDETPVFIRTYAPLNSMVDDDDVENIEQLIRVGIPLVMVFEPSIDIITFLKSVTQPTTATAPSPSSLSADQQLALLTASTSCTKH